MKQVAMVGAGISGLSCASRLQQAGFAVTLFDKSRGCGGRITTRRRNGDRYDHGAQYFTVKSKAFQQEVDRWRTEGIVVPWVGRFVEWTGGNIQPTKGGAVRWVAQPRMSALGRYLARDLSVHLQTRIVSLERVDERWTLVTEEGGAHGGYDVVLLCCPGPQAAALLPLDCRMHAVSESLSYGSSWVIMVRYEQPVDVPYDAIRFHGHPTLAWAARDNSKPGREPGERWVLQTQADWSALHLELSSTEAVEEVLAVWSTIVDSQIEDVSAHRWRYALSSGSVGVGADFDAKMGLGLCGDGLTMGRLEAAWTSGRSLAELVLS